MNNEHKWEKEFREKFETPDFIMLVTSNLKYGSNLEALQDIKAFISSERQKAYEEAVKEVDIRSGYTAGRQSVLDELKKTGHVPTFVMENAVKEALTELLAELPHRKPEIFQTENLYENAGFNKALSAIRDLIEKKKLSASSE